MSLKFNALIFGGIGPDVWDRELSIDAVDITDALQQAQAKADDNGGTVAFVEQDASPDVFKPRGTEADVCSDIARRQEMGIEKYGMTVSENPLSLEQWLQHAYEECLDKAVYLKRAIQKLQEERRVA
ncbi:MAG: hypothetical protein ACO1TE_27100 [Prosthecobacter sp.]